MEKGLLGAIALGSVIVIGILSGCLNDPGDEELSFSAIVYSDEDTVAITVTNGTINWTDKELRVGNHRLTTSLLSSSDGEEVEFIDVTGAFDAQEGTIYRVSIVYLISQEVLWEDNVTAIDKEEGGNTVETFSVDCSIDATNDRLTIEVLKGNITWSSYDIRIDGASGLSTTSQWTSAGSTADFTDQTGTWDPQVGNIYNVKIINSVENKVVWEKDIIGTA